mgnify:CR=1 FL=1
MGSPPLREKSLHNIKYAMLCTLVSGDMYNVQHAKGQKYWEYAACLLEYTINHYEGKIMDKLVLLSVLVMLSNTFSKFIIQEKIWNEI